MVLGLDIHSNSQPFLIVGLFQTLPSDSDSYLKQKSCGPAPWSRACQWCPRVQWNRVPMRTDRCLLPHAHAHALTLPDPQPGPGRSGNVEVVTCCGLTIKVVVTPRGAASPLPTP